MVVNSNENDHLLLVNQQGRLHDGRSGGGCPFALVVRGRTGQRNALCTLVNS